MKNKLLNYLLLLSFICTVMVPITGIKIHKLASALFLLLCIVHSVVHRSNMNRKRFLLIGMVAVAFLTGIFGMIFDDIAVILVLHRAISIVLVFFMAIHIFVYKKKLK